MKLYVQALLFVAALLVPQVRGSSTPDYYKCVHKVSGEWLFGRVPSGCDASSYGEDSVVYRNYPMTVFDDQASRNLERIRYMEELHAIVRDAARYYIKKRKPNVSAEEVEAFAHAILTTAAHETKMSHYRRALDDRLKLMRGDFGHGHGMMQMDDRYHFPAIELGVAWNLIPHLTYSMDIFYDRWQKAPAQSCVGNASAWTARSRAAWSAFNGSPTALCRWATRQATNGDAAYYDMLKNKDWQVYVKEPKASATLDVPCLMERPDNCPLPSGNAGAVVEGVLYKISNEKFCVLSGKTLHCVSDFKDAICLNVVESVDPRVALSLDSARADKFSKKMEDRHVLCQAFEPSLHKIGDWIELQKNVFVRQTPGGGKLGVLSLGELAEVMDFQLADLGENNRYYQVKTAKLTGYIYSGNKTDHASWTKTSETARVGDEIKIKNVAGINMRATPEGLLLVKIPVSTQLKVQEMVSRGDNNSIYYKVTYGSKTGYIYAGRLLPSDTTDLWISRVRDF